MRFFQWLPVLSIGVLSIAGCTAEETVSAEEEQVLAAFEEQGMQLTVSEHQSEAFDFPAVDETAYEFDGGSVLVFTDYGEPEQIEKNIEANLAEMEFPYPVNVGYFEEVIVMVMPESDDPTTVNQVEAIFRALDGL